MNPDKIGKFILQLRSEKHLSQYQLADKIPISRQAVSKWERGQTIPDSSTLIRLSELFNVTINELLNGERRTDNTIKELEETTLSILDDSNKKTRYLKVLLHTFIPTILILIIILLSYYFINTYNTIKVYKVYASSKEFNIVDGILITTKQKTYLKLGKVQSINNVEINNISLYYIHNGIEQLIYEDKDIDTTVFELNGYEEMISLSNIKELINDSYLIIVYDNLEFKKVKLNYKRDFVNNNYLIPKVKKLSEKDIEKPQESLFINNTIKELKVKGYYNNSTYMYDIEDNKQLQYHEQLEQIILKENNNVIWTVFLNNHIYICNNISKQEECEEKCKNDIKKYLYEKS